MGLFSFHPVSLPEPDKALPGRPDRILQDGIHHVLGTRIVPPFPVEHEQAYFGMGCFWGAEKQFWTLPGIGTTAVGYAGGYTPNPTYEEVCTGQTGHAEVVLVDFDPAMTRYDSLLQQFFEGHDPTQGMRQGNDVGTQYRSIILTTSPAQEEAAMRMRSEYASALRSHGYGDITTVIAPLRDFFYAEAYHQQYLQTHPDGYCGHGGTGVACPLGTGISRSEYQ